MTSTDFRAALHRLGLTQRTLAATLGVERSTVNRWARGKVPVPEYAHAYLGLLEHQDPDCVRPRQETEQ